MEASTTGTSAGGRSEGVSERATGGCFVVSDFFLILKGRTGADDNDPTAVAGLVVLDDGLIFGDEIVESADPGRSRTRLLAVFARFCAAIVSLMEGLAAGTDVVLRDNAGALLLAKDVSSTAAVLGCGFGLDGSSTRRSCCFLSSKDRMLALRLVNAKGCIANTAHCSDFSGDMRANAQ